MVSEFIVDSFQWWFAVMIDKKVLTLKTLYLGTPCLFAALRPYNVMQLCSKCKRTKGREETCSQTTFAAATTCYVSRSIPPNRKCRGVQILSAEYDQQVGAVASKVPSMGLNMSAWPRGTAPHQGAWSISWGLSPNLRNLQQFMPTVTYSEANFSQSWEV